ncbi:serine hydrolase-like protein 2 [Ptiloglossa arizonensis]|uniref:serine hydrolase-like protein 2 n=1 Tax=Ptiloglossa arizonensis TaxID=3350558 RepID=UPI003FA18736
MNQVTRQSTEVKLPVPWGYIAAKIYGSPGQTNILVVHGMLDNAGSFDRLIELLPEQYHYVSIDLPGHGLSTPFPSGVPLQFFDYVYSISFVLDALKWKTCVYMGHSFGAQIGTYFSILYPGRLQKIVAIDGFIPLPIENLVSYIQTTYDLDSYNKNSSKHYTKDEIIYALMFRRHNALNTAAAEALFKRAVSKVDNLYKYNRDPRLRYFVKPLFTKQQHIMCMRKFSTPILIIMADTGNRKRALFNLVNEMTAVFSDKSKFYAVIIKGNHDVHNNYPEKVAPHVCKFLDNNIKSKL